MNRPVSLNKQRGFSLVTAIFVLVVLAALGGYMVSISGTQHFTTLHALQGAKAYHAARSGIEWSLGSISNGGVCSGTPSLSGNLADFTVTVSCDSSTFTDGVDTFTIYNINSVATTGTIGTPGFAARQIQAVVKN